MRQTDAYTVVGRNRNGFVVLANDDALKAILTGVLFFGGVCCAVFLGGSAQKKLQTLMQEQFGDFFRTEWEKAFGPNMHTPEMCVDEPFLRTFHLLDDQWEECTVENFHEGDYRGVHFSAANVRPDEREEHAEREHRPVRRAADGEVRDRAGERCEGS